MLSISAGRLGLLLVCLSVWLCANGFSRCDFVLCRDALYSSTTRHQIITRRDRRLSPNPQIFWEVTPQPTFYHGCTSLSVFHTQTHIMTGGAGHFPSRHRGEGQPGTYHPRKERLWLLMGFVCFACQSRAPIRTN